MIYEKYLHTKKRRREGGTQNFENFNHIDLLVANTRNNAIDLSDVPGSVPGMEGNA